MIIETLRNGKYKIVITYEKLPNGNLKIREVKDAK